MKRSGILGAIGNTPLIRLDRMAFGAHLRVFAKLEMLNPGGSSKDRPAVEIIERGIQTGAIRLNTVVIESSSGNMGIGMAQVCRFYDLRFICVVDAKTTQQNLRILSAYGADIEMIPSTAKDFLKARIERVKELVRLHNPSFWPQQYSNPANPKAHFQSTMAEIHEALGNDLDFVFCATSTCGTIRGCAEYIAAHGLRTRVIAVDALGSAIFKKSNHRRLIPGLGASLPPPLMTSGLCDRYVHVTDMDCIRGCQRLIREEAILAGGSSGGVVSALDRIQGEIPQGSTVALILPDRGERYLDTIYCEEWIEENFGEATPVPAPTVEESLVCA